MKFGDFVREKRREIGYTLRGFCLTFEHDPSNWSKIERGTLPPSGNPQTLASLAEQLNIKKGSDTWQMFSDLAYQERGKIPPDILDDEELAGVLPLFFQILRRQKPTKEELDRLIESLSKV